MINKCSLSSRCLLSWLTAGNKSVPGGGGGKRDQKNSRQTASLFIGSPGWGNIILRVLSLLRANPVRLNCHILTQENPRVKMSLEGEPVLLRKDRGGKGASWDAAPWSSMWASAITSLRPPPQDPCLKMGHERRSFPYSGAWRNWPVLSFVRHSLLTSWYHARHQGWKDAYDRRPCSNTHRA